MGVKSLANRLGRPLMETRLRVHKMKHFPEKQPKDVPSFYPSAEHGGTGRNRLSGTLHRTETAARGPTTLGASRQTLPTSAALCKN